MTKRAVLYARVSGDDRKYATSGIESQLEDCENFAKQKGYKIVGKFHERPDKHTSGADWLPELEKILRLAHVDGFDVLVVREIDRLARNRFKQMSIEVDLESLGKRVEYVKGQFEDSPEGRLLRGMMSEFAEFERGKIRQRTENGILRSVSAGNVKVGGSKAPYGYDRVKVGKRRTLQINEGEAAVVRLIFDLYVNSGYTLHALADYLDHRRIPKPAKGNNHKKRTNKTNKKGWSVGTLNGILKNETYVGRWYYRKTKNVKNPKTGKTRNVPRPKNEWLLVSVPSILDEEIFNAAQERMKANKKQKGKNRKHFYVLGGMLKCGLCGNSMSGITKVQGKRKWGYYKCNAHHLPKRYGFKCENAQYKKENVDGVVWQWVKSIMLHPDKMRRALSDFTRGQMEEAQPLVSMIETNNARLAELGDEKARLIKAYSEGVLSIDEFAAVKRDVDKQIADLTTAVEKLERDLEPKILNQEDIDTIESVAAQIRKEVDLTDGDPHTQRKLYKHLDMQVTLSFVDGQKWAEVQCVFGRKRLATDYTTT